MDSSHLRNRSTNDIMATEQQEYILRMFTDKYTEDLVDRQVSALVLIAKRNVNG